MIILICETTLNHIAGRLLNIKLLIYNIENYCAGQYQAISYYTIGDIQRFDIAPKQ